MNNLQMLCAIGALAGWILGVSAGLAQVFPPRQPQPAPQPMPPSGNMTDQTAMPPGGMAPGVISRTIPFIMILGDPTKSFIQISNMRSPFDTNFVLGRGLAGRIALEKYTHELGSGQKAYLHLSGVSNPPIVTTEGTELRFQFVFPKIQFKTYYKDYSGEGDSALTDLVSENVLVDVFIVPTLDQRQLPTFHSVRIGVTGSVKEADKCTYFFDLIFPVNICTVAGEYFKQIQPALENGIREVLLQPQTRAQFEQQMFQFVRWDLLSKAGVNPNSQAQFEIVRAEFRGTDYVVNYIPRQ